MKKNQKNIAEILSENNSLALIEVNLAQAEMKKAGLSIKKIADAFNVSTSTILNWLKIIN